MKRNVSHIIAAVILLLTAGSASTGEQPANVPEAAKLEMKLSLIELESAKSGNKKQIQVNAEIRNVGNVTVLLPTKEIGPSLDTEGTFGFLNFSPDGYFSTRDGFRIPIAKSEYAIVDLRPHEAFILHVLVEKPGPGLSGVQIDYSISKEFAERYGTWTGKLDGGSLQLPSN